MQATFYAIFNARGFVRAVKGGTRGRHQQPSLGSGERAVRLQCTIPDRAFQPEGIPTANLEVPEAALRRTLAPVVTIEGEEDLS
jgi:hypothetical protein